MITLTYTNHRFGDTFSIYLDDRDFSFIGALRYIGGSSIGGDGIQYDTLDEVPDFFRHDIEALIKRTLKNV